MGCEGEEECLGGEEEDAGCGSLDALLITGEVAFEDVGDGNEVAEDSDSDHARAERTMMTVRALSCPRTPTLSSPTMVHHPSLHNDESTHLVSLTSTTYGSLKILDDLDPPLSASFDFAIVVTSAWGLMDGLDNLPSPTTSFSIAIKISYFFSDPSLTTEKSYFPLSLPPR